MEIKSIKKIRLQTFDNEGNPLEDRLVNQDIELKNGPKETHDGPLKVEVCLFQQDDIDLFIEYLQRLKGTLPLEVASKAGKKKEQTFNMDEDPEAYISHIREILESGEGTSIDGVINQLRDIGYTFITTDLAADREIPLTPAEKHGNLQWLIKLIKEAKDPRNNKYDPRILIGVNLIEKKKNIHLYQDGEFVETFKAQWSENNQYSFQKTKMIKFPEYMTLDEREKWRKEHYALQAGKVKQTSKFYDRWLPYITAGIGEI